MSRPAHDARQRGIARRPFVLFIAILILALAQIVWWVLLLVRDSDPAQAPLDAESRNRRIIMVTTEGVAFALAMTSGAWLIYRSLRAEERLRLAEANFLAAVTHELKSPLASLRLHTESLELRPDDSQRVQLYSSRMLSDIDRLHRLVDNLLAANQAQIGILKFNPVELDLSAELLQYANHAATVIEDRGFDLQLNVAPGVRVKADPGAVRSVLENLLDNAMKYSEPPAVISLNLIKEGNFARVEVSDPGVGLDPAEAALVFQRFYRAGDERVRTTKGIGLGLFLVREIAHAHGGEATVESPGRGRGATFRVTFPLLT